MSRRIYLDNAATTRLLPAALDAMRPCFLEDYANPSAVHEAGEEAEQRVTDARKRLSRWLQCRADEVIFTSGGSEADNLALLGAAANGQRRKVIVSAVEHPAVRETAAALAQRGHPVVEIPVDETGMVREEALAEALDEQTALVSIMHANNEIGTVQPIARLARLVKERQPEALFHTDAVQSFAHVPVSLAAAPVDLLSLSAHKFHGPKGVGALVVRKGTHLRKQIHGGDQEAGLRAGTLNVPGIVGMACAADHMCGALEAHRNHLESYTEALRAALLEALPDALNNGHPEHRLPGLLSVSVPGIKAQNLMLFLESEGVIVSAGAACKSTTTRQSHVLAAIGQAPTYATIRLSASIFNALDEVPLVAERFVRVVKRLRK